MDFTDKVVLVTGAARNTGLAIAERFARDGAVVCLNSRKAEDVAREAARLRKEFGARVVEVPADVALQDQVDAMFETIRSECGRLDVLVNNAILQGVGHAFVDTPRDLVEQLFAVNVFGVYACSQAAARMMIEQGGGAIVNIGSNTAERAIRNRTAYCATKGAIESLTRAMAGELGPHGIRVNTLVAGYIHSDRWAVLPEESAKRRRTNVPLGRESMGEDIADGVQFLASDAAKCITGTRLVVDGGCLSQLFPPDCDQ